MLQMIERVLASLIILGMLVVVLFLALDKTGDEIAQTGNEPQPQAERLTPVQTPPEPSAPEPSVKDEIAPVEQAERTEPVVPDPGAPAPKETAQAPEKPAVPKSDLPARVKPKVVKKRQDKLPASRIAEAKPDKRNNVTRIRREPSSYKDREAKREGYLVRRADYRDPWRRDYGYECADGWCDCSCEQPFYWARSNPACWDW